MTKENMQTPVIVILGATGGIGSAVCRQIAERVHLVMGGRDSEKLDLLSRELGGDTVKLDATDVDEVAACFSSAKERHGRVDGAVNCVGSLLLKPAHLTTAVEWDEVLRVNLGSAFAVVRGATQVMRDTGGSLVLVSSAAARHGLANHEAIGAAKAGVIGLTLSAAASYARRGIRVNAVAPGLVQTPMTRRLTSTEGLAQASRAMHPLGRLGTPDDVASMISWLIDPGNGWVTGQVFGVDGGLATLRPQ